MLLNKNQIKAFYDPNTKQHNIDAKQNPGWFTLRTTSKQFKKLYDLRWEKDHYNKSYKAYLTDKHPYDLLLHKAMKYVREGDVN